MGSTLFTDPYISNQVQTNFLERTIMEGLDPNLAFLKLCERTVIPAGIGDSLIQQRISRLQPSPNNLQNNFLSKTTAPFTRLDDGMTPMIPNFEQWSLQLQAYGGAIDINILTQLLTSFDQLTEFSRLMGVHAAESLELVARNTLVANYAGGNTRVRSDLGAATGVSVHVDDLRGFTVNLQLSLGGLPQPVSNNNPLLVEETPVSNAGVLQQFQVIGYAADSTNYSSVPNGISGVLTIQAIGGGSVSPVPVNGDAIIAANAPAVVRPNAKATVAQLTAQDNLNLAILEDAIAKLRMDNVPCFGNGTYPCLLDPISKRQIFADQDFKVLYAGRFDTAAWSDLNVTNMLGLTFIDTNYAPNTPANSNLAPDMVNNPTIHRVFLVGAGAIIQGTFESINQYLNREGIYPFGRVTGIDDIAFIIRNPLDRFAMQVSLGWFTFMAFNCPTDNTSNATIAPTFSPAAFKRCIMIEHA